MATRIRLQRHGRKGYPFYKIVVADSRAPRDGKFIERLGSYNPNTNPATIDLDFDRALYWVNVGAQPSDTVRSILSKEGVLLMKHLQGGVAKGAFDEETAKARFEEWLKNKKEGAEQARSKADEAARASEKKRLEAEQEVNKAKAKALADKRAEEAAKKAAEEAAKRAEEEAANAPEESEAAPAEEVATEEAPEASAESEAPATEE